MGVVLKWNRRSGGVTCIVRGERVGHAGGGGYDKHGAAFAEFLTASFQPELCRLHLRASRAYTVGGPLNYKRRAARYDGRTGRTKHPRGLYGMTAYYRPGERRAYEVRLDGACGFDSMRRVVDAMGLRLEFVAEDSTSDTYVLRGLAKLAARRERDAAKTAQVVA